ncbi:MAG: OmpA family protein [Pseudomonadota bacterium]
MKLKTTLFAAVSAMAVAPAANADEGWYGSLGAGYSYVQDDLDTEIVGAGINTDSDADYDNGYGVYFALGKHLGNGFRGELEYSYRDNDVRHIALDGQGGLPNIGGATYSGDLAAHFAMLNLLYDFSVNDTFTPYIGGGIGYANIDSDFTNTAPAVRVDDAASTIAAQGIAGLAVALADNLSFDLSYRYVVAGDTAHNGTVGATPVAVETSYHNHSIFGGLRFHFGGGAAPVEYKDCWDGSSVPVTAECPPQVQELASAVLDPVNFTVYFDYNKSNLTPEASNLVREAASRALSGDIDTVVVAGNTDTSGGAAYNQRLSERRAAVVRDALIANGVPADRIRTEANGESNLAKPTPDGTREPLNRRTEVTISFE